MAERAWTVSEIRASAGGTRARSRGVRARVVSVIVVSGIFLLAGCAGSSSKEVVEPENVAAQVDKASAQVREAQALELRGKAKDAIAKYQEAIGSFRELPVAWNNMGRLLMKQGENLQAADAFKTAAELSPTDPRPLYNLGALWEELGYLEDSTRWYDEALARDSKYLPALRRRVLIDQLRDRCDERTFEYVRAALAQERDPWWIDRLKRAELRLRQSDSAPSFPTPARRPTRESPASSNAPTPLTPADQSVPPSASAGGGSL